MKTKAIFTVSLLLLVTLSLSANPPETEEGKTIFTTRCAACHSVNKILTGPALAGITERRSLDWIIRFVQSSQTMLKNGDADAITLFQKFNKMPMPDHADLTPEKINSILDYIQSQSQTGVIVKKPAGKKIKFLPLSLKADYPFFIGYIAVVLMLVLALLFAVQSTGFQKRMRGKNLSA